LSKVYHCGGRSHSSSLSRPIGMPLSIRLSYSCMFYSGLKPSDLGSILLISWQCLLTN
jgi:hypothetical protein